MKIKCHIWRHKLSSLPMITVMLDAKTPIAEIVDDYPEIFDGYVLVYVNADMVGVNELHKALEDFAIEGECWISPRLGYGVHV